MSEVEFTNATTEHTLTFGSEPAKFKAKFFVLASGLPVGDGLMAN